MQLENEKIILRDILEEDVTDYIKWCTVETEWQDWDAPWEKEEETVETAAAWHQSKLQCAAAKQEGDIRYGFEIIEKDNGTHLGWVTAYRICGIEELDVKLAIGIDIAEKSQRRNGYGFSAMQLFIDYLKQYYDEIYAQTWSGNVRMIGLADKLGFKECHRIKDKRIVNGKFYDALTFKLGD